MKLLLSSLLLALLPFAPWTNSSSVEGHLAEASAPAAFSVDAGHSAVVFKTKHVGVSNFYGRFNKLTGKVGYDAKDPSKCSIELTIDAASVDTNSEGRDDHLKGPDFFSVKEFPEITFTSKSVKATDDGLAVEGNLDFHGVTKSVTAMVEVVGEGEAMGSYRAGFEAHFKIDMADFDISFVKQRPGALGPVVDLIVSLECTRD